MRKKLIPLVVLLCITLSTKIYSQGETLGTPIIASPVIEMSTGQLMEHWMPIVPPELKKRNIGLGLKEPERENYNELTRIIQCSLESQILED